MEPKQIGREAKAVADIEARKAAQKERDDALPASLVRPRRSMADFFKPSEEGEEDA